MSDKRNRSPIILFTPYYGAATSGRQTEIDECLHQNINNTVISKIILLNDDGHTPPITHPKIEIMKTYGRPTYKIWLELSHDLKEGTISLLANSDIYFNNTLNQLTDVLYEPEVFVVISRHDRQDNRFIPHPNPHWSQDAWAIRVPFQFPATLQKSLNIPLGVPRCDNKIAYVFAIHGWKIINPFNHITAIHIHETQLRTYNKYMDRNVVGGVAYVHPGRKINEKATLDIQIWAKGTQAINKVSINKSFDTWEQNTSPEFTYSNQSGHQKHWQSDRPESKRSVAMSCLPSIRQLSAREKYVTWNSNNLLYKHLWRFRIYNSNNSLLCIDALSPRQAFEVTLPDKPVKTSDALDPQLLAVFIPPILDLHPITIKNRPLTKDDYNFWQYPAATERQAYNNHLTLKIGENIDEINKTINIYLALPWATYIDKKCCPNTTTDYIKTKINGLRSLAERSGYNLSVHSVCQHIRWNKLLSLFNKIGITDLHISHCEKNSNNKYDEYNIRIYSWPLIAVNVENKERYDGLTIAKKPSEKHYLASFIGADLPIYRSNARSLLFDEAKRDRGQDIYFELGGEWHFQKIVYEEQVKNNEISILEKKRDSSTTKHYNEILSDSIFSLCPEGSGPNTLRLWESLAVGSIPVIISDNWLPPKFEDEEVTMEECSIFVKKDNIDGIFDRLRTIKYDEIIKMHKACLKAYKIIKNKKTYKSTFERSSISLD